MPGVIMNIPSQSMEIESIYTGILESKCRSVAITSANAGEGVSSLAISLTQRNLLAGRSTLLVDLNLYHPSLLPSFLTENLRDQALLHSPQLVSDNNERMSVIGVIAPNDRAAILKLRKPGVLETCLEQWYLQYDTVIIDTSPLNHLNQHNIPAERVAAACDACLMVVLAGRTRESMVSAAIDKLNYTGSNLVGCVINDRDNPSLKSELLRESIRLEPRFTKISLFLRSWINSSSFFSLEM